MALRRGFKTDANWYASQMRAELELAAHGPLCFQKLAAHLGYQILPLSSFEKAHPAEVAHLYSGPGEREFSAITICDDQIRIIIHNDAHHRHRQTANIVHELAHGLLNHIPVPLRNFNGARSFNREQEEEASWLGPALLISDEAAIHIVENHMSLPVVREMYSVSNDLLQMRLRVTGAAVRVARRRAA